MFTKIVAGAALAAFIVSEPASANILLSPFTSTVEGVSIRNAHEVARGKGLVLRGMAPLTSTQVEELVAVGIDRVLIFRNDNPCETGIADEKKLLDANPAIRKVTNIPFTWKALNDFKRDCLQTVEALREIRETLATPGSGLFFHCTVGEDRTGFLAGLYRVLFEKLSPEQALAGEMCAHGYAEGDPQKPMKVVKTVHENITPLYIKMTELIARGTLTTELESSACDVDPASDPVFADKLKALVPTYVCK